MNPINERIFKSWSVIEANVLIRIDKRNLARVSMLAYVHSIAAVMENTSAPCLDNGLAIDRPVGWTRDRHVIFTA